MAAACTRSPLRTVGTVAGPVAGVPGLGGDDRLGEPETCRLGQPPVGAGHPAQLTRQAHLAEGDHTRCGMVVPDAAEAMARAAARSADGSATLAPPTVET